MNNDCVFCNLRKGRIIAETKNTMTLLSDPYLMKGHSLVVPKLHVERLSDLSHGVRHELIDEVMKFQQVLMNGLKAQGVDLRQNYRPFLPNSKLKVSHLHFHLVPRWFEDELYEKSMIHEKEIFKDLTPELTKELKIKLK